MPAKSLKGKNTHASLTDVICQHQMLEVVKPKGQINTHMLSTDELRIFIGIDKDRAEYRSINYLESDVKRNICRVEPQTWKNPNLMKTLLQITQKWI